LIENFFCRIKALRRIATRYEKTDTCFAAMIYADYISSDRVLDLELAHWFVVGRHFLQIARPCR